MRFVEAAQLQNFVTTTPVTLISNSVDSSNSSGSLFFMSFIEHLSLPAMQVFECGVILGKEHWGLQSGRLWY